MREEQGHYKTSIAQPVESGLRVGSRYDELESGQRNLQMEKRGSRAHGQRNEIFKAQLPATLCRYVERTFDHLSQARAAIQSNFR